MRIDEGYGEVLRNYWLMSNGRPSETENVFPRMLYFSAVTVTTLGYGDIVPISTLARLFVALESILGILIIGWFINEVSK